MGKRILIILALFIIVILTVTPEKTPDDSSEKPADSQTISDGEEYVVAGIYRNGSASWFIDEGLSAKAELERLGVSEFIYIDGKRNPEDYLLGVKGMIDEQVDGMILCQPYEENYDAIADMLVEADIPFVTTNTSMRDPNQNLYAPSIGVDDYALGHMTGDWMANYTIKNGLTDTENVGLLLLANGALVNMELRKQGQIDRFLEMIPYFSQQNIYSVDFDGTIEDGLVKTKGVFINTLDITYWLVMASSDEGAIGAVRSLEQLGMDSSASVTSIGGSLAVSEFKREYSALKSSGYYSPSRIGRESAKELHDIITGKEQAIEETFFNAVLITKDNYQEYVED